MASAQVVKEGFLVKKGHVRHNWRTRWFVLRKNQLSYFRKRGDSNPAGVIPLVGATLECPPPDVTKKPWILRLKTHDGKEYMIQAPDEAIRGQWSGPIEECIRTLDPVKMGTMESLTRSLSSTSTNTLERQREMVRAMQDPIAGVKLSDFGSKRVTKYFTGKDIVDWLIAWSFATQRGPAADLATSMLRNGFFHQVNLDISSRVPVLATDVLLSKHVLDNEDARYVFVSFTSNNSFEMLDSDDSSSDSEDDAVVFPAKASLPTNIGFEGRVIKQGFLLKKSKVTKQWKPRRFVLKEKSQHIYYYRGSKSDKHRGTIPLSDLTVYELDDEGPDVATTDSTERRKSKSSKGKFNRILLITAAGERYILEAPSPDERNSWIGEIRIATRALQTSS